MTANLAKDARGHIYQAETLDLSADTTSLTYDVLSRDMIAFHLVWADLDQMDGAISMQCSNDGQNWSTYYGSSVTLADASGSHLYDIVSTGPRYVRMAWSHGTNSAGSAVLVVTSKTRAR